MSSIIAHGLGSLTVYEAVQKPAALPFGRKGAMLGFGLGLIPDLDVLAMIAFPQLFNHRGPSHSLAFAWGLAMVMAWLLCHAQGPSAWFKAWLALGLVMSVHPLLDYLMACGPGVPFFWPWSETTWLSPMQLMPTAYYAHSLSGLAGLLKHTPTFYGLVLELFIFLPLLAIVLLVKRLGASYRSMLAACLLAGLSLAGVWRTFLVFG
jgi:membrane-bound metal-dependent hydrolase YbcI (DUF457 family)